MDATYEMKVYGHPIKETQDILLRSVLYSEVIEGLNGYFASEPRNYYITIRRQIDGGTFFLYDPEKWADILISWLRTRHEIFYYPGMEATYAKTERIPPLTERLMDEWALNSLKKLHKRVTGEEPEVDSHTLIADNIRHTVYEKESEIEKLKEEIRNLNAELATKWTKTSLINWLQQRARHKGVEFDDRFLYSDDPQYDWTDIVDFLFDEIVKMRGEIENLTETNRKDLAKAVKARAEYAESISRNTERSDINKLISDYCTKFDITPPSPYFGDKACVEYLFSVVDLERKHRAAIGKQMVDDYEKNLLRFIYKAYAGRTCLSDETITYNPPSVHNTIIKIIRDYARNRTRVDILETRIRSIFDKYKTKFTVDDNVINGDPTISFMLDCIWSWVGSSAELRQKCDFLEDELGKEAVIREFLDRRRATQTKLDTIEKKLEELLKDVKDISNT